MTQTEHVLSLLRSGLSFVGGTGSLQSPSPQWNLSSVLLLNWLMLRQAIRNRSILAVPNFSSLIGAEGKIASHSWYYGYSRDRVMHRLWTVIFEALNCQNVTRSCSRRYDSIHKSLFAKFAEIALKAHARMLRNEPVFS